MLKRIFLLIALFIASSIFGQTDSLIVKPSPEGIYLFVSSGALHPDYQNQNGVVEAKVYRTPAGEDDYEEIGTVRRAETIDEFRGIVGEQFINDLLDEDEISSEEEIWSIIQENPNVEDYGFLAINTKFLIALGTAFLDENTVNGIDYVYRVEYLDAGGSVVSSKYSDEVNLNQPPNILRPVSNRIIERDSLIVVSWKSEPNIDNEAFYARVYKSPAGKNSFTAVDELIFATNTDTGIVYVFRDEGVTPESAFKYYMQPLDIVQQPGPVSDTVVAYSVNFNNIPLMGKVEAKDTTGGIYLWWEEAPRKPYFTGIEIQRSKNAGENYVVLDTVNVRDTSYLDDRLLPNIKYFYSLKLLALRETGLPPSSHTSASYTNKFVAPDAPQGFTAEHSGKDIKLTWEPSPNPDIYSYFVYRGVTTDSMKIVSPAIKDDTTYVDTSKLLDGRTSYTYAVTAVNYNELESEFSNLEIIKPDREIIPPEPFGLTGYVEGKRIRLNWQDMRDFDNAVNGYNLYRRDFSEITDFDNLAPAAQIARKLGFDKLNQKPIDKTVFDDNNVNRGSNYQYAISSVDIYGVESGLSPITGFEISQLPINKPSNVTGRSVDDGVQIFWNQVRDERVTGYAIYRRTRDQSEPERVATFDTGVTNYVDVTAAKGAFYFYSVSVIADKLESERSEEVGIKTE